MKTFHLDLQTFKLQNTADFGNHVEIYLSMQQPLSISGKVKLQVKAACFSYNAKDSGDHSLYSLLKQNTYTEPYISGIIQQTWYTAGIGNLWPAG